MKLDEAKELLKKEMQQTLYVIEKCSLESQSGKEQWKKEAQAIETVLQELERLQNENEELERRNNLLECCKYINADCLVVDKIKEAESARWQDKIKEKIEELRETEKMYALDFNVGRKFLEELLKGE
ncbi:MAG: hypothetical protein IJX99_06525 [Clostridia bacterium]|nr:hypothetical protein [Clostridia bacterium]